VSTDPNTRRAARTAAVQALYQMDLSGDGGKAVIAQFVEHRLSEISTDQDFFTDLVEGVVAFQAEIDATISDHLSKKWSLNRLDKTLRAIMRAGTYEIMRRPDVPALVVLDEYVSIASDFFDDKEAAFVNGALEKVAKQVRMTEFGVIGSSQASD